MYKILFIGLSIFFSATATSQDKKPLPPEVTENIEKRIEYGYTPSIALGIIDKDGPKYFSFGKKSRNGEAVDEHTIYEIGSISKVFTGILLAYFDEKGSLDIDDPVEKYLPDGISMPSRGGQKITLGHLSDHTSSLTRLPDNMNPANSDNPYADYTVEQMYDFLSRHELRRDIGSEYEYSNLAQGLLGHILALHAESEYEDLMINVIATPLGMNETKIALDKHMKENLAIGHNNGVEAENWDIPTLAGAGAIRSSVHDMLIFLSANLGFKKSPLMTAMNKSHLERHDKGGMGVGLGWHIKKGAEGDVLWHNGGTGGYRTFAGFVKETGKGVVVLTNSTAGADDIGFHLLDSSSELNEIKPSATDELKKILDSKGIGDGVRSYKELEESGTDTYQFSENDMNGLGYHYLGKNEIKKALAVFKLNVESYPNSSNVYDSYGEALRDDGQTEKAIENYKKSIELNPGNINGIQILKELGVEIEPEEIQLEEELLQRYTGTYNLAPNFDIVITSEGRRLYGQATGQPRFELFAKSDTEFYLKVVNAQVVFQINDAGETENLILYQGGQTMPGKKMK